MMGKDGYSREGFFGEIIHYDSKGHKIGESRPSLFGGYSNYDAKGHKVGETRPGFFGYNTYDNKGHKTGSSSPGFLGTNHYDAGGHKTGTSMQGFLGTNTYGAGSDADIIGRGVAATLVERDMEANSSFSGNVGRQVDVTPSPRYQVQKQSSSPGISAAENIADENPKIVRYVICHIPDLRVNRNYLCNDESVSIGDFVRVSDQDVRLEVLAVVECDPSAAPELSQKVLYK